MSSAVACALGVALTACGFSVRATAVPGECDKEVTASAYVWRTGGHARIEAGDYARRLCGYGEPLSDAGRERLNGRASHYDVGEALRYAGASGAAMEAYRRDLAGARGHTAKFEDLVALSRLLAEEGWQEGALAALDEAEPHARKRYQKRRLAGLRAGALEASGAPLDAIEVYARLEAQTRGRYWRNSAIRSQARLYLDAGYPVQARAAYFRLRLRAHERPDTYVEVARTYLMDDQPQVALDIIESVLDTLDAEGGYEPWDLRDVQAEALEALDRPWGAASAVRARMARRRFMTEDQRARAHFELGRLHRDAGEHSLAFADYRKAYELHREDKGEGHRETATAAHNVGVAASSAGADHEALRWLEHAAHLDVVGEAPPSETATTLLELAKAEHAVGLELDAAEHFAEAVDLFEGSREVSSHWVASAYEHAGRHWLRLGACGIAVDHLEKALDLLARLETEDVAERVARVEARHAEAVRACE